MSDPFRTVLRGYDPTEVEHALEKLKAERDAAHHDAASAQLEWEKTRHALRGREQELSVSQQRIVQLEKAEREAAPPSYADLGQRVGSILTLAQEEATALRAAAVQESDQRLAAATQGHDRLIATASALAKETSSKAQAEAAKLVADAKRAADEMLDEADREAGARREEAEAVYEHQRARAAAAAAEFEQTLADRRERSAADFSRALVAQDQKLSAAEDRLKAVHHEADDVLDSARSEAASVTSKARAEAESVLAIAKERAERIRRESERELAAATARRDAITAQLSNVRQMLATLGSSATGGAALFTSEPEEVSAVSPPMQQQPTPAAAESASADDEVEAVTDPTP